MLKKHLQYFLEKQLIGAFYKNTFKKNTLKTFKKETLLMHS